MAERNIAYRLGGHCECENLAHMKSELRTPHGNPGHKYGQEFFIVVGVVTPYGTFLVCEDCRKDCLQEYPQLVR